MTNGLIEKLTNEFNRTKDDHPQYASGLSAAIVIVSEHEATEPGTVATDNLELSGGQSDMPLHAEVSVALKISGILATEPHHRQLDVLMETIRPYLAAREPVSGARDLVAMLKEAAHQCRQHNLEYHHATPTEMINAWEKAAAGVPYVD